MKTLSEKLNYKGQMRIAIINSQLNSILDSFNKTGEITIDREIDPRYPYEFMILFVKSVTDVRGLTPVALHNLTADGVLWFCYPKKSSKKFRSDVERDHGWKPLNEAGFYGVRLVALDDDWSAMRFRNIKYIRSTSGRYPVQKK